MTNGENYISERIFSHSANRHPLPALLLTRARASTTIAVRSEAPFCKRRRRCTTTRTNLSLLDDLDDLEDLRRSTGQLIVSDDVHRAGQIVELVANSCWLGVRKAPRTLSVYRALTLLGSQVLCRKDSALRLLAVFRVLCMKKPKAYRGVNIFVVPGGRGRGFG